MFGKDNENEQIKDLKKNLGKSKVPEQYKQELFKLLKVDKVSEETLTKIEKAIKDSTQPTTESNNSSSNEAEQDVTETQSKPKMVMVVKNKVIYKCNICDFKTRDKKGKCSRHPLEKMVLWNQK